MNKPQTMCRCGSAKTYPNCCEPFLNLQTKADTAEQLMRSRFSAFSLHKTQYLIDSLHPSKRQAEEESSLQQSIQNTCWIQLNILQCQQGKKGDSQGTVEFTASFEENGEFYQLHEESNFIYDQQWYYTEGDNKVMPIKLKFGRNDLCWCHSGKKYKKCHGS